MSLKTKISLTASWDWKEIQLTDLTGTGITGYGAQQEPATYREVASIVSGKIVITDRDGNTWTLIKSGVQMQAIVTSGATIVPSNVGLDSSVDTQFDDTIFTFLYLPRFENPGSITTIDGSKIVTYAGDNSEFENVTHIIDTVSLNEYVVSSIDKINKRITLTTAWTGGSLGVTTDYLVGLGTYGYVAIADAIKTCLDERVVDIAQGTCKCKTYDVMHQYLMYDAMIQNLIDANQTRAYQMYDWLTAKCEEDCGCY